VPAEIAASRIMWAPGFTQKLLEKIDDLKEATVPR
jgi:hypothetical protein